MADDAPQKTQETPFDVLYGQTADIKGPVLPLKAVKELLDKGLGDDELVTSAALRFSREMAKTAEQIMKSGDQEKIGALNSMGGQGLITDLDNYNKSPSADAHQKVVDDFKQITGDAVKQTYNVELIHEVVPDPAAPAAAATGPNAAYENTKQKIEAINPEAAKTFQAWAELDSERSSDPSVQQAKAQLRELFGGQIDEAVKAAAKNHDDRVIKAAKDFMGQGITIRGDKVDNVSANPTDLSAQYAMAEGARNVALTSANTAPDNPTSSAVEMEGISQKFKDTLTQVSAIAPNASRTLMAAERIENHQSNPAFKQGMSATLDKELGVFAAQMQQAEARDPAGKQAVLDFVKSQGGNGDSLDAIKNAARHAIEAGVSGGQSQSSVPTSPGSGGQKQLASNQPQH